MWILLCLRGGVEKRMSRWVVVGEKKVRLFHAAELGSETDDTCRISGVKPWKHTFNFLQPLTPAEACTLPRMLSGYLCIYSLIFVFMTFVNLGKIGSCHVLRASFLYVHVFIYVNTLNRLIYFHICIYTHHSLSGEKAGCCFLTV